MSIWRRFLHRVLAFLRPLKAERDLALGAPRGSVVRTLVWETPRLVLLGLAVGLPCALAAGHLIAHLLFGLRPASPADLDRRPDYTHAHRPAGGVSAGAPRVTDRPDGGTAL